MYSDSIINPAHRGGSRTKIENMKTLSTSEFANYIFRKFNNAVSETEYMTSFVVYKAGCYPIISVYEPKSGKTRIEINGKRYSAMTATEKRDAIHFIEHFEFDIVVGCDLSTGNKQTLNYVTGTYVEGQQHVMSNGIPWYRFEKVTHIK